MSKAIPGRLVWVLTALVASAALLTAGRARAEGPLRLEDAVRLALLHNERAQKTTRRVAAAEGQLQRARTAFFPSLTGAANEQIHGRPNGRTSRATSTTGTLTLSQPLLDPSAFPLYSQSSHQLESEKWGAAEDRRVLAFDTARSFLQVLTAQTVLKAAEQRLARSRVNLETAEARAAAQLASTNDATRSRLELASALREVAQARGSLASAYLQLGFLTGTTVRGPLAPPDRVTRSAERFESTPSVVTRALDRRPDVRAARERTLALEASASEPYYRLIPTIGASAQLRVVPNPVPTQQGTDETVTFNLSWDIFDAGQRYADRKTRKAQAESQALDEHLLRRSVGVDVQVALVSLRAARESYKIATDALASAQQNTEETAVLYRQGLARAIELNDANATRFDAEVTQATTKLSMEQAYLDLRFALGLGPIDDAVPSARR